MPKRLHFISLLVIANIIFVGVSFVAAQTGGFTEPDPTVALSVPLTTSESPQAVNSAIGVGIDDEALIPANTMLYIQGNTAVGNNTSVVPNVASKVIVDATPKISGDGSTLAIQGTQITVGWTNCPNDARFCVIEDEQNRPAVDVLQEAGIGLWGQTSASGKAGVYGFGHYGVYAYATNSSATPIVGQSCDEAAGSPGSCLEYGTAGFFDGNFIVEDGTHDGTGVLKGVITGDGRQLYRVQSLFNLNDPVSAPESKGVAYKTYGVYSTQSVNAGATRTILNVLNAGETFSGMYASYKTDGETVFHPADALVEFDEFNNSLILRNTTAQNIEFRVVISYLLPN